MSLYRKPPLVACVTCGDPDLATTREAVLAAIDAGADVIEPGVPFSDPLADGPVIQRASERALRHGPTLEQVIALASEVRRKSSERKLAGESSSASFVRTGGGCLFPAGVHNHSSVPDNHI